MNLNPNKNMKTRCHLSLPEILKPESTIDRKRLGVRIFEGCSGPGEEKKGKRERWDAKRKMEWENPTSIKSPIKRNLESTKSPKIPLLSPKVRAMPHPVDWERERERDGVDLRYRSGRLGERDGVNLRYRSGRLGERERERERETMSISVAMPVDWGGERRRSRETVVERGKSRLGLRCWNEMLGGSFDFFFFISSSFMMVMGRRYYH